MNDLHLLLFVYGRSPRTEATIAALRQLTRLARLDRRELEVIDVQERPEEAERWGILATPTVVRVRPLPQRRATGEIDNLAYLLDVLGLTPRHHERPTS